MSMYHKLIEYSVNELETAQQYADLAKCFTDANIGQKFNEIAKDEIRHHDYLLSILDMEVKKNEGSECEENMYKTISKSYSEMFDNWKEEILFKISTYQPKK